MEERSTTESESQLGRGHRKKKISRYISKENGIKIFIKFNTFYKIL